MAIYTGTWKNGDGVAFDPAAFSIQETPAVTTSTVEVYGVTNPDCTGTYEYTATHNGLPYFTRDDDAYVLFWYQTDGHWTIAVDLTEPPVNYWASGLALEYFFGAHGTFAGGPHPFITPHPDFTVSGILTPDATGTYAHAGTFNNLPYWQHTTGPFFLYYSQGFWTWLISPALQDWPADGWFTASIHQSVYWAFGAYFGYTSPYYDPAPDITVHQTSNPEAEGTYIYQGLHNAYPYWTREDDAFSIWADPAIANWFLSVAPGDVAAGKWWTAIGLTATYTATAPYTGNPNLEQFILTTSTAYGTARTRIAGRRGGTGSPPGQHHGTPTQEIVRVTFTNRMKAYVDMPEMSPETFWENAGQDRNWLTRAGAMKTMHGQAFYPRTVDPPAYIDASFPAAPDLAADPPPVDDADCTYVVPTKVFIARLHYTDAYDGGEFSGWSVFHVNPKAVGHTWFYKHTRIVGHRTNLFTPFAQWWGFAMTLHWDYVAPFAPVAFFRIWYKNAFLNFGPLTARIIDP